MDSVIVRRVLLGFAAFIAIIFFFGSWTVVRPGNTGVIFNQMTGTLRAVDQGLALKVPFVTSVQSYPTALRTYTMVAKSSEGSSKEDDSLDLPTLEGQHIRQDMSITYNTSPEKAAEVYKAFRGADIEDIENTFIRRTIITVAQNAAGQMSLTEVISAKRGEIQTTIQEKLSVELNKMGFTLDKVNMGASHLPATIEEQMQKKMAAQQDAQQAQYQLSKEQMLAKALVAKAEGQAQSKIIEAKAEAESNSLLLKTLTDQLVRSRAIEKWDGKLPVYMLGNGTMPMINIDKK